MIDAKQREARRSEEEDLRLARIRDLEQAMAMKEQQMTQYKEAHDFVKQMIDEGEIPLDEHGNVMAPSSKRKC